MGILHILSVPTSVPKLRHPYQGGIWWLFLTSAGNSPSNQAKNQRLESGLRITPARAVAKRRRNCALRAKKNQKVPVQSRANPFKPVTKRVLSRLCTGADPGSQKSPVLGFRVGGLAYCTDVSRIPDESWPLLQGLDVLVLDALRYEKHPTHFSLSDALAVIETLQPRRACLTHLSHSFDHRITQEQLPPRVVLAHDGLQLEF